MIRKVIEQDTYWRRDLLKFGERLEKRYRQRKWSPRTLYNIEKEVFLSFYAIRKLIESRKVDSAVSRLNCAVTYPIKKGAKPSLDPKTGKTLLRNSEIKISRSWPLLEAESEAPASNALYKTL